MTGTLIQQCLAAETFCVAAGVTDCCGCSFLRRLLRTRPHSISPRECKEVLALLPQDALHLWTSSNPYNSMRFVYLCWQANIQNSCLSAGGSYLAAIE